MGVRTVRAGDLLCGKLRVERVIGVGGMGLVVAAHHVALDQRVALKLMLPESRANAELVSRFVREARAAARLRSPHVTRVLDVGALDDGTPYIVMEYLEGADLETLLTSGGPISAECAAAVLLQVSHAIAEAHRAGIVHRDLKPSNLFVTRGPDGAPLVKVLDLGICKLATPERDAQITTASTLIGTPTHMAPEQMRSARSADARSDIWSLGVILFQMMSGTLPFHGETFAELCLSVMLDPCPRLPRESLPAGFEAIIGRCLAKDPAARFQTVSELAAALDPYAGSVSLPLTAERSPPIEPTLPAEPGRSVEPLLSKGGRRRTWTLALAGALLGGAALVTFGRGEPGDRERPVPTLTTAVVRASGDAPPPSTPATAAASSASAVVAPDAAPPPSRPPRRAATSPTAPVANRAPPQADPLATPD